MTTTLTHVTAELIDSFGNTAHHLVNAYRVGGDRIIATLEKRWDAAFEQSRAQLTPEVRQNALAAQKLFGSYYVRGLTMATDGADMLVGKSLELAGKGLQQVAANAATFQEKTGVSTLNTVAQAVVPAAVMVRDLAGKVEQQSALLVQKIAGNDAQVADAPVKRETPFKKARARKAA